MIHTNKQQQKGCVPHASYSSEDFFCLKYRRKNIFKFIFSQ